MKQNLFIADSSLSDGLKKMSSDKKTTFDSGSSSEAAGIPSLFLVGMSIAAILIHIIFIFFGFYLSEGMNF